MTTRRLDGDVDLSRYVAEAADRLHDRLAELSSGIQSLLEEQIPELRGDARVMELLGASVEGNVDTVLHALRYDIAVERVESPTAALEYARRLAQHGVPVNALVRAYRLGQRQMNEIVFAEVRAIDIPESVRYTVVEAITRTLFEYIDWISQQVVAVYEDERERWLENQNSLRAVRVREVLAANKAVDADASSTSIRYPLRWHHLAVIMWCPDEGTEGDELASLQRFVRELAQAAGADANPLFVAADRLCGYGWLPFRAEPSDAVASGVRLRPEAGGRPESGDRDDGARRRGLPPLAPRSPGSARRRDGGRPPRTHGDFRQRPRPVHRGAPRRRCRLRPRMGQRGTR